MIDTLRLCILYFIVILVSPIIILWGICEMFPVCIKVAFEAVVNRTK
jgi:hypothetical protein